MAYLVFWFRRKRQSYLMAMTQIATSGIQFRKMTSVTNVMSGGDFPHGKGIWASPGLERVAMIVTVSITLLRF